MACSGSTPSITSHALTYNATTCRIQSHVVFNSPCGASGYKGRVFMKKGSPPSGIGPEIWGTVNLNPGPSVDTFDVFINLSGLTAGTYYVMAAVICDGVNLVTDTKTIVLNDDSTTAPIIGEPNIRLHAAVGVVNCTLDVTADVTMPCLCGPRKARLYISRGGPPAIVPNNRLGNEIDLAAGPAERPVVWNNLPMVTDGKWYLRIAIFKDGAFETSRNATVDVAGCEMVTIPEATGAAVPHEGVDELIYLVRVTKTDTGYQYDDHRVLSQSYQMIDWWYSRNGGCGSFRLLLRETFEEFDGALQEGWEIHVRISLTGNNVFDTWYRGVIRSVETSRQGAEILTEVRGQGYIEQLASVQVQRRYPKGQTVRQVVLDILDHYILPNTRIIEASDQRGVDDSDYVLAGPIHFECSILRALKFLSDLQGDREFGVSSDRQFYFRAKKTEINLGFFTTESKVVNVIDGGKEVDKANVIKFAGKQWGHDEELVITPDVTDISNFGFYEKPVEVPWVEHRQDAQRWSLNLINRKKIIGEWTTLAINQVDDRMEENHAVEGLDMVRVYGADVSNDFTDFDISKIHYFKGGFVHKSEVREIHRPRGSNLIDQPVLRAVLYCGQHHHDIVDEMEDRLYDPLDAFKARAKQFKNPRVDVTNPDPNEITVIPGQLWAQPKAQDVTSGPFVIRFRGDLTQWPFLVKMRVGDVTQPGDFVGEEFFLYDSSARTTGVKYYWNGTEWIATSSGGGSGGSFDLFDPNFLMVVDCYG